MAELCMLSTCVMPACLSYGSQAPFRSILVFLFLQELHSQGEAAQEQLRRLEQRVSLPILCVCADWF